MTAVRWLMTTVLVALVATAVAVAWPTPSTERASAATGGVMATGDSIELFERRVDRHPADVVSRTVLGSLYAQRGRETGSNLAHSDSAAVLEEALALLPTYEPAQLALASTQVSRHRFSEAIELAQGLLGGDDAAALAVIVDAAFAIGDYALAAERLADLAAIDRTSAVLVREAQLLEVTGDQDGALVRAHEALDAARAEGLGGERLAWHLWRVGDLHRHVGQLDLGARFFAESEAMFPGFHLAIEGLGDVAAVRGDHEEALRRYEQVALVRTTDPGLMLAIADELDAGRSAAEWRVDAMSLWSDDVDRVARGGDFADVFLSFGEVAMARELVEEQLQHRQDPGTWHQLAVVAQAAGNLTEARDAIDQALRHGQQEPDWLLTSAEIWEAMGQSDRAQADLARIASINPRYLDPTAGRAG